jgi:hypothetical protein
MLPLALMMASGAASAGLITNESELLTGSDHAQLSEWLCSDFDLTRIFAKGVDGNAGEEWHAAVDGNGSTFTVMEIIDNNSDEVRVIGGYSNSWGSTTGYATSATSFLFSLSDGLIFEKTLVL